MARVLTPAQAQHLGLPGRSSLEIVSGAQGALGVTLRLVEIPVPQPGETPRGPHLHRGFEVCIYVLSGTGTTASETGEHNLTAGDTLLMPAGEKHVTRNTGTVPLRLLCFFPVPDVASGTEDASFDEPGRKPAAG